MWNWNWKKREQILKDQIELLEVKQKMDLQAICNLEKLVENMKAKEELEYKPGRQVLVIKLGDKEAKWIPSEAHFSVVRKFIKNSGLDKKYNILLYHYGIEFTVPGDPDFDRKIKVVKYAVK